MAEGGVVAELPLASQCWRLKSYGRWVPRQTGEKTWKMIESSDDLGPLTLTIVQSGHFLVCQGHTLLEGFSLIDAPFFLKVMPKSDHLLFSVKIKNECRMFRVQFDGANFQEAVEFSRDVCFRLQQYTVMGVNNKMQNAEDVITGSEEQDLQGRLPICCLAQSFLEGVKLSLPLAYQHSTLQAEDLGAFLRLCLLDHRFPAFVEQVESELQKIVHE
ncbi:meiotic recombination protein REC114 [Polypterus senegalus]|uniref:meiotic recombination protein REC114 n=1 Tax=Polypterus senegalus TaxID=55291 RepID=UPI001966672B|nr:meiotic recombination protein REC114 [Polypterus senegalus]